MAGALASGGVLDGGDWIEGWQYGPLAVAEYALAARAITRQGVTVDGSRDRGCRACSAATSTG